MHYFDSNELINPVIDFICELCKDIQTEQRLIFLGCSLDKLIKQENNACFQRIIKTIIETFSNNQVSVTRK